MDEDLSTTNLKKFTKGIGGKKGFWPSFHMWFLPDFQGDFCMVLDMGFSDLKGHMFLFLPTESSTGKSQVEIFGGPKMGNVRKLSKLWNIVRFEAEETPNET